MRGFRVWLTASIAAASLVLLSYSPASALQFWISKAGESAPLSSLIIAPDEVFSLSVWVQHTAPIKGLEVMLGWDRSTSMGTAATPLDREIILDGTVASAVTNLWTDMGAPTFNALAGARGTGTRPWGLRIVFATLADTDVSAGKRIFDIRLKNRDLIPGEPNYPVVIWDLGSGASYTSLVILGDGTALRPGTGAGLPAGVHYRLELVPVPEPGSLVALATGVVGLAGVALRRRRA